MKRKHHFHHIVAVTCAWLSTAALISPGLAQTPPRRGPTHPYHPAQVMAEKAGRTSSSANVPVGVTTKATRAERSVAERTRLASPIDPGPRLDGEGTHGIIFVGGHAGIDHSQHALNPQPIPPGHSLRHLPKPDSPIKAIGH